MSRSTLWKFVHSKLKEGLPVYLSRAQQDGKSCRTIASELTVLTGIRVSKSTVDRWMLEP